MQKNLLPYYAQVLEVQEPDLFLLSLFAPEDVRADVWAVLAFHHEIAKTRSVVSESTLGHIRLQWWRDEISKIYNGQEPAANEVLIPLAQAIRKYNLPQEHFFTMLYAREFDLADALPADLEGLLNYADFTTTPLFKLVVQIMGDDPEIVAVYPFSVNYAVIGILRATALYARQARCCLPKDMLDRAKITREMLENFENSQGISKIIKDILSKSYVRKLRGENKFLKAGGILADIYARQLKAVQYNPYAPRLAIEPNFKVLRLWFFCKFM